MTLDLALAAGDLIGQLAGLAASLAILIRTVRKPLVGLNRVDAFLLALMIAGMT